MKIWFQTFEWPPDHGGGLSTYMKNVTRMLCEAGHDVVVLYSDPNADSTYITKDGPHLQVVHFKTRKSEEYRNVPYWVNLSRLFKEASLWALEQLGKPDVIEISDGFGIGYYTLLESKNEDSQLFGIPFVCTAHTPIYLMHLANKRSVSELNEAAFFEMERYCYECCDIISIPTRYLQNLLEEKYALSSERFNFVRLPFYNAPKDESSRVVPRERDHFYIGSRVEYWKGALHTFRLFKKAWSQGDHQHKLVFYGNDTHYDFGECSLVEQITKESEGYSHLLEFRGKQTRETIEQETQTAFCQIHPSLQENFPYAVTENMSAGRITLASTSGGQAEMIEDGVSGFLFSHNDPSSFDRAIKRVIALTDEQRECVQVSAKQRIKKLTDPEAILPQKISEYASVVKAKLQRPEPQTMESSSISLIYYQNSENDAQQTLENIAKHKECFTEFFVIGDEAFLLNFDVLQGIQKEQVTKILKVNDTEVNTIESVLARCNSTHLIFLSNGEELESNYLERVKKMLSANSQIDVLQGVTLKKRAKVINNYCSMLGHSGNRLCTTSSNCYMRNAVYKLSFLDSLSYICDVVHPAFFWQIECNLVGRDHQARVITEVCQSVSHNIDASFTHQQKVYFYELFVKEFMSSVENVDSSLFVMKNDFISAWVKPNNNVKHAQKKIASKLFDRFPPLRKAYREYKKYKKRCR